MLSHQANNVTLPALKKVKLRKPPEAGFRWNGIKHSDLVEAIISHAERGGLRMIEFRGHLERGGYDLTASLTFTPLGIKNLPDGYLPSVGFTTSNRRKKALRFYAGVVHKDTDTPIVLAQMTAGRSDQNQTLDDLMQQVFEWWTETVERVAPVIRNLKETVPSSQEVQSTLFVAGRGGMMPWSRIGKIDKLFKGGSALTLLNTFSRIAGMNAPGEQMDQILRFGMALPVHSKVA